MTRAQQLAIVSWLTAAVMILFADADALAPRVADDMFATELAALDRVAGVRDDAGKPREGTIGVRVDVEGPAWASDAARAAVAADEAYVVADGPHRLVGEIVVDAHAALARWSLERRGWAVHAPTPTVRRLLPALAFLPLLLGVLAYRRWGHAAVVALVSAAAAQVSSLAWPWPPEFPLVDVGAQIAASPLVAPFVAMARALDDRGAAIAGGVVALCVVLAWFDHRRARGNTPLLSGLAIVVAFAVWCEAAARVSCGAWFTTAPGIVAALAVALFFFVTRPAASRGAR